MLLEQDSLVLLLVLFLLRYVDCKNLFGGCGWWCSRMLFHGDVVYSFLMFHSFSVVILFKGVLFWIGRSSSCLTTSQIVW